MHKINLKLLLLLNSRFQNTFVSWVTKIRHTIVIRFKLLKNSQISSPEGSLLSVICLPFLSPNYHLPSTFLPTLGCNALYSNEILWGLYKAKKNSVSQSCHPHLFFCAHLILQNSDFNFFSWNYFFFHFYYEKRRKFAVLEEFKHVRAQKTCKILSDFWKYGSWNFSVIFGFGCAWRQRPIEVKKKKIK